ncbi:MAG: glycosyltransferase family 4 protein [Caulobacteraceae bacterium]
MNARTPILFDATRLVNRRQWGSPTGIDRVLLAYAKWLLYEQTSIELTPVVSWSGRLTAMPTSLLQKLVLEADEFGAGPPSAAPSVLSDLIARLQPGVEDHVALRAGRTSPRPAWFHGKLAAGRKYVRSRVQQEPPRGVYLNVGHSGLDRPGFLDRLSRRGLTLVIMLQDLIPISWPEYCAPAASARHIERVDSTLRNANLVLANSQSTADGISAYARSRGLRLPRMEVTKLGIESSFLRCEAPRSALRPYFLFIGTIEARKNLAFLLTVWRRLGEEMGASTPHLVLLGRRGWENESAIDLLERSAVVKSVVHEAADLGDHAAVALLAGARALLAPSFAEGFDLPVMEGRVLGTPVIASDIPVHRELAPEAELIDPLDGSAWAAAIRRQTLSPLRRVAYEAPTWEAHFDQVSILLGLTDKTAPKSLRAARA